MDLGGFLKEILFISYSNSMKLHRNVQKQNMWAI